MAFNLALTFEELFQELIIKILEKTNTVSAELPFIIQSINIIIYKVSLLFVYNYAVQTDRHILI